MFEKDENTFFKYIDQFLSLIGNFPPSEKEIAMIKKIYSLNFKDYEKYFI